MAKRGGNRGRAAYRRLDTDLLLAGAPRRVQVERTLHNGLRARPYGEERGSFSRAVAMAVRGFFLARLRGRR